jgi:hypothetical protein
MIDFDAPDLPQSMKASDQGVHVKEFFDMHAVVARRGPVSGMRWTELVEDSEVDPVNYPWSIADDALGRIDTTSVSPRSCDPLREGELDQPIDESGSDDTCKYIRADSRAASWRSTCDGQVIPEDYKTTLSFVPLADARVKSRL